MAELSPIIADRLKLLQIVVNLILNARDALIASGEAEKQMTLRAYAQDELVRLEVEDNGPGIPASERENVFRPFYRLDHARNQNEGNSGLGLAIARDIAKSHGGEIALGQSSMGGLRAIISLPL